MNNGMEQEIGLSVLGEMDGLTVRAVEVSRSSALQDALIAGQKKALKEFGVEEWELNPQDFSCPPLTHAVYLSNSVGEVVGGIRIHFRSEGHPLPLETEQGPLPLELREQVRSVGGVCEIRGLWVQSGVGGRFLSRKLVTYATELSYRLGGKGVVAFSHERAFRLVSQPVGYQRDSRFPAMAYPDERFVSFVIWHWPSLRAQEA